MYALQVLGMIVLAVVAQVFWLTVIIRWLRRQRDIIRDIRDGHPDPWRQRR